MHYTTRILIDDKPAGDMLFLIQEYDQDVVIREQTVRSDMQGRLCFQCESTFRICADSRGIFQDCPLNVCPKQLNLQVDVSKKELLAQKLQFILSKYQTIDTADIDHLYAAFQQLMGIEQHAMHTAFALSLINQMYLELNQKQYEIPDKGCDEHGD